MYNKSYNTPAAGSSATVSSAVTDSEELEIYNSVLENPRPLFRNREEKANERDATVLTKPGMQFIRVITLN